MNLFSSNIILKLFLIRFKIDICLKHTSKTLRKLYIGRLLLNFLKALISN